MRKQVTVQTYAWLQASARGHVATHFTYDTEFCHSMMVSLQHVSEAIALKCYC